MGSWVTVGTVLVMIVAVTAITVVIVVTMVRGDGGGGALYLTPLIQAGRLEEAKSKSNVSASFSGNVRSHAGYITVNSTYNSNLFFWFFPAKRRSSPLLLWLNGGPGYTSMIGALLENGPLVFLKDDKGNGLVRERQDNYSWTEKFHMLYVDSPVGAGFSYTSIPAGNAKTMDDVVPNLYKLLIQFYKLFSEYQTNDLYLGGQSYAGKYIPALAVYIHQRNHDSPAPAIPLPLRGVYIGGGLCDAETMFPEFPESLYYAGLISRATRDKHRADIRGIIQRSLTNNRTAPEDVNLYFEPAVEASDNGEVFNMLGNKYSVSGKLMSMARFMNLESTRKALHVGYANGREYVCFNWTVSNEFIQLDLFVHTREENAFLMDNYKVLHYTGNLDLVVSVAMTEAFLDRVQWTGHHQYSQQQNSKWWSQNHRLLGWVSAVGNFTRVIVRNAGHHVPFNQPQAALEMMTNFVFDQPFVDQE